MTVHLDLLSSGLALVDRQSMIKRFARKSYPESVFETRTRLEAHRTDRSVSGVGDLPEVDKIVPRGSNTREEEILNVLAREIEIEFDDRTVASVPPMVSEANENPSTTRSTRTTAPAKVLCSPGKRSPS